MRPFSLACCLVVSAAGSASADWQYTRWGMTVAQVASASKGQLKECPPVACDSQGNDTTAAKLFGTYLSGEFAFTAFALFDRRSNKLMGMRLSLQTPTPERGASLAGSLRGRYGEPASEDRTALLTLMIWREKADQIAYLARPSSFIISYQPSITDSNKGL